MSRAWKKFDLEGAGLQALNLHLARNLRRRRTAYLLWSLFPLGAHRLYLQERRGALLYLGLSGTGLLLWLALGPSYALPPLLAALGFALYDLIWIERRVTALNKRLRMELYLGAGAAPPRGYRGRYVEADYLEDYIKTKEAERAGQPPPPPHASDAPARRAPSLAEQEALLRELGKGRKTRKEP